MIDKQTCALLIVDIQNDFCPNGHLAVAEGDLVIPIVNQLTNQFDIIVQTQDWHPAEHLSFASNHDNKSPYDVVDLNGVQQVLWPDHCVQGSSGAEFHPDLNTQPATLCIRKGMNPQIDSYSAFLENDKQTRTGLDGYLKDLGIKEVYLVGLATDYCVLFSALDAVDLGYKTHVIIDACRGVDVPEGNVDKALATMKEKGIRILQSADI